MTNDQIEKALAKFAPAPMAIDRDELMYRAGFNAARDYDISKTATPQHALRIWQSTTALATAASIAMAFALWQQPSPQQLPQMVAAPVTEPEQLVDSEPASSTVSPVLANESSRPPRIDPLLLADPTNNYFALRATILERGVDAWPGEHRTYSELPSDSGTRRPPTVRRLMEEMLPAPTPTKSRDIETENPNEASNRNQESVV
ncbi:hypothetical protein [Aeoliella sp. SH292]|uniref:hypothetical protein n=1 Tax=Aeoliella sp. SH292 TaxID=3454464 RepID=UPI003F951BD1